MVRRALQKAIYTELDDALPYDVYDAVPQDAEYPYVAIGDTDIRPWESDESMGYRPETRIHVYSKIQGRLAVNKMLDEVEDVLNRNEFSLPDYDGTVITCNFIFSSPDVEPDGIVRSGRIDFALIIGGQ